MLGLIHKLGSKSSPVTPATSPGGTPKVKERKFNLRSASPGRSRNRKRNYLKDKAMRSLSLGRLNAREESPEGKFRWRDTEDTVRVRSLSLNRKDEREEGRASMDAEEKALSSDDLEVGFISSYLQYSPNSTHFSSTQNCTLLYQYSTNYHQLLHDSPNCTQLS